MQALFSASIRFFQTAAEEINFVCLLTGLGDEVCHRECQYLKKKKLFGEENTNIKEAVIGD